MAYTAAVYVTGTYPEPMVKLSPVLNYRKGTSLRRLTESGADGSQRMEGSSWQSDAIVLCVPCHRHPQRPVANPWPGNAGGITMARFTAPVMRALRKMSWHVSSRRRPLGQPAAVRLMPEGLENEDGAWICASGTHENTVGGVGLGLIPSRCGFPRMTFTMKRMSIILERPVT